MVSHISTDLAGISFAAFVQWALMIFQSKVIPIGFGVP
jgi:hypothetical protein